MRVDVSVFLCARGRKEPRVTEKGRCAHGARESEEGEGEGGGRGH